MNLQGDYIFSVSRPAISQRTKIERIDHDIMLTLLIAKHCTSLHPYPIRVIHRPH